MSSLKRFKKNLKITKWRLPKWWPTAFYSQIHLSNTQTAGYCKVRSCLSTSATVSLHHCSSRMFWALDLLSVSSWSLRETHHFKLQHRLSIIKPAHGAKYQTSGQHNLDDSQPRCQNSRCWMFHLLSRRISSSLQWNNQKALNHNLHYIQPDTFITVPNVSLNKLILEIKLEMDIVKEMSQPRCGSTSAYMK